jgi:hypothetical protein
MSTYWCVTDAAAVIDRGVVTTSALHHHPPHTRRGHLLTLSSLKGGDSYGSRREISCFIADCPPGELR